MARDPVVRGFRHIGGHVGSTASTCQFFEVLDSAGRVCDGEAIVPPFSGSRTYAEGFAVADEFRDLHWR